MRRRAALTAELLALMLLAVGAMLEPARAADLAVGTTPALVAPVPTTPALCAGTNSFAVTMGLSGNPPPCALAPGAVSLEAIYFQNASNVGGTALAAYPLLSVSAGLMPRLQFSFTAPSEVAQSQPGGGGAFPITHLGYGLTYTVEKSARVATAVVTELLPPDSRFAPQHVQSRYDIGLVSDVALSDKWTLGGTASATSSQRVGFGMLLPTFDVSAGYAASLHTQFVATLGTRFVTRHAVSQSFTDLGVNQSLSKKFLLMVGVGTTFNAVNDTKPHYLASGFAYRP